VKRLFFPLCLALIIHGLFLSSKAGWLKKKMLHETRPRTVTLSLAYKHNEFLHDRKEMPVRSPFPRRISKAYDPERNIYPMDNMHFPQVISDGSAVQTMNPFLENKAPDVPEAVFFRSSRFKGRIFSGQEDFEIDDMPVKRPFPQVISKARPVYRKNPPPEYPGLARKRGYQGTVFVEVLVGVNGKAKDVRMLVSSGYPILDNAALRSVKEWVFEPGMRGSESVKMWVRIPIRFQLK